MCRHCVFYVLEWLAVAHTFREAVFVSLCLAAPPGALPARGGCRARARRTGTTVFYTPSTEILGQWGAFLSVTLARRGSCATCLWTCRGFYTAPLCYTYMYGIYGVLLYTSDETWPRAGVSLSIYWRRFYCPVDGCRGSAS